MRIPVVENYKTTYLLINSLLGGYSQKIVVYNKTNTVKSPLELFEKRNGDHVFSHLPSENIQGFANLSKIKGLIRLLEIGVYKISTPGLFKIVTEEALKFYRTLDQVTNLDLKA